MCLLVLCDKTKGTFNKYIGYKLKLLKKANRWERIEIIKILASGSSGNCYILETKEESLILECGINIKDIVMGINYDLSKVKGCLISHSHSDHSKSVKKILDKSIDVFTGEETIKELGIISHRLHQVIPKVSFKVGGFTILPFDVKHDVQCMGYLIYHEDIGKVLFATDTYYLEYKFNDCNYVMIECNYDEDILHQLPPWRARTIKSHMSMQTCIEALKTWNLSKCKNILLIHLSSDNGDPVKFQEEVQKATEINTIIAKKGVEIL